MENEKLRALQLTELELFKQFDGICRRHGIRYYALGGTLLGAVRHQGFIPWDDDMDLGVPREGYEKLKQILPEELKAGASFHTFENDPAHYRYFSRIEDDAVKVRRTDNQTEELSSAWIDIFPLDGMPNHKLLRTIHKYYILYRRAMLKLATFDVAVNVNKKGRPLAERVFVMAGLLLPTQKLLSTSGQLQKLDRALKRFSYKKSDYLVNAMGAYKFREMFHKKHYGRGKWYPFEDTRVFGPADYDFVCRQLYGDYMTPVNDDHHKLEVV